MDGDGQWALGIGGQKGWQEYRYDGNQLWKKSEK